MKHRASAIEGSELWATKSLSYESNEDEQPWNEYSFDVFDLVRKEKTDEFF